MTTANPARFSRIQIRDAIKKIFKNGSTKGKFIDIELNQFFVRWTFEINNAANGVKGLRTVEFFDKPTTENKPQMVRIKDDKGSVDVTADNFIKMAHVGENNPPEGPKTV